MMIKTIVSRNLGRNALKSISKRGFAAASSSEPLVKTALYDLHVEIGGDMVPFAGYELPVLYKGENGGVMKEHLWCRSEGKASLFDVSHMGQVRTRMCRKFSSQRGHATRQPCSDGGFSHTL